MCDAACNEEPCTDGYCARACCAPVCSGVIRTLIRVKEGVLRDGGRACSFRAALATTSRICQAKHAAVPLFERNLVLMVVWTTLSLNAKTPVLFPSVPLRPVPGPCANGRARSTTLALGCINSQLALGCAPSVLCPSRGFGLTCDG